MYIFVKDYKDYKAGTVIDESNALFDFKEMLVDLGFLVEASSVSINYRVLPVKKEEVLMFSELSVECPIRFSEADNTLPKVENGEGEIKKQTSFVKGVNYFINGDSVRLYFSNIEYDTRKKVETKSYSGKWYVNADFLLKVNGFLIPILKSVANTIYFDNSVVNTPDVHIIYELFESQKESVCESMQAMGFISRETKECVITDYNMSMSSPLGYMLTPIKPKEYVARFLHQGQFRVGNFYDYKIWDIVNVNTIYPFDLALERGFFVEKTDDLREFVCTKDFEYNYYKRFYVGDRFLESKDYKNENAVLVSDFEFFLKCEKVSLDYYKGLVKYHEHYISHCESLLGKK